MPDVNRHKDLSRIQILRASHLYSIPERSTFALRVEGIILLECEGARVAFTKCMDVNHMTPSLSSKNLLVSSVNAHHPGVAMEIIPVSTVRTSLTSCLYPHILQNHEQRQPKYDVIICNVSFKIYISDHLYIVRVWFLLVFVYLFLYNKLHSCGYWHNQIAILLIAFSVSLFHQWGGIPYGSSDLSSTKVSRSYITFWLREFRLFPMGIFFRRVLPP